MVFKVTLRIMINLCYIPTSKQSVERTFKQIESVIVYISRLKACVKTFRRNHKIITNVPGGIKDIASVKLLCVKSTQSSLNLIRSSEGLRYFLFVKMLKIDQKLMRDG